MLGVANIRGRLLPIIDLHTFLGLPATVAAHQARVLVVERGEMIAGLLIEQSLGIQHFASDVYEAGVGRDLDGLGRFVKGAFRHAGRVYHHVELRGVLHDEAFMNVSLDAAEEGAMSNYWHLPADKFELK